VEKFGQGTIVDDSGALSCSTGICRTDYHEKKTVILTAQPAPGWQLHGWSGCDHATDSTCTVFMNKARTVYPTFERTAPPVLRDKVFVLDAVDVANIVAVQDGAVIFSSAATNMASLPVGTILVSTIGEGFARKVTKVVALPGSSITLATSQVPLEEVIGEGTIIFHRPLTNGDLAAVGAADGVRFMAAAANSPVFTFEVDTELESGVKVKGTLEIEVTPDFALDFSWWSGVTEVKAVLNASVKPTLEVTLPAAGVNVGAELTLPVPPLMFIVQAGPVTLVEEITPKVKISADADVGVTMTGWVEVSGRAGIHYLQSVGWRGIGEADLTGSFDPLEAQGKVEASVMVGPAFTTKIYGVAGPSILVGPYVDGSASYEVFKNCGAWSVWGGGRASATIEGSILGWKIKSVDLKLFDIGGKLAGREYGACTDTESPSQPGAPVVDEALPTSMSLHWTPSTDNVLVEKYEVYRDHDLVGETAGPSYVDTGLTPDTKHCYYIRAVDPSSNRSTESPATCRNTAPARDTQAPTTPTSLTAQALSSRSIALSWSPSTDDAGFVSYQIYDAGGGEVLAVSKTTSATISRLEPSTQYCFRVAAFDGAGNVSELSNQACATTRDIGTYRMRIKCEGASYYAVDTTLELDEEVSNSVSVVGTFTDYNGKAGIYVLTGNYDSATRIMDSRIDWDFERSSCHRADVFQVNLATVDTGDVYMDQVQRCGCTAQIRFTRGGVATATEEAQAQQMRELFVEGMPTLSGR
jgi:chitodextrinase